MQAPPDNLSPDELWAKLEEAPRPTEVVDFPRRGADGRPLTQIRIQVLTQTEHDRARINGRESVMKEHKVSAQELDDPIMKEVVADACAKEALAIACLSVQNKGKDEKPFYPYIFPMGAKQVGKLTADEVQTLFHAYTLVQNKYGPFLATVQSAEEYNAWIRVLVEGGRHHFLAQKSWLQLAELAIGLAERAYTLSLIVESQSSSLPSSLEPHLRELGIGTSYYTGLRLPSPESGDGLTLLRNVSGEVEETVVESESEEDAAVLYGYQREPGETLTIERAAEIAKEMHK